MGVNPTIRGALDWPLMRDNVSRADLDAVIEYLKQDEPILTHAAQVRSFEREWSDWVGVKHSIFVSSGSSANLLTLAALKALTGGGEIIVPPLTWVSDIAAVLHCGFDPVFVDIDSRTLGMDPAQVIAKLTPRTRAVFLTHVLGYNALTQELLDELQRRRVPLIEDVCESHGATFKGRRLGSFGLASNFSFYYAHHMSCAPGTPIPYLAEDGLFRLSTIEELYDTKPAGLRIFCFDDGWRIEIAKPSMVLRHHRHGKQMYQLKLRNNRRVEITEDHSVFTWDNETMRTRTVKGSQLKPGDYVVVPRRLPSPPLLDSLDFLQYCRDHSPERFFVRGFAKGNLKNIVGGWRSRKDRLRSNYASRGTMPLGKVTDFSGDLSVGIKRQRYYNYIPASVPASAALARFIGFFVAEGSCEHHGISFSFHIDEKEYITDVLRTGHEVFGAEGSIYEQPETKSAVVKFHSPILRIFMVDFLACSVGAKNKRVPRHVFHFSQECKVAFLYGLFRGDGAIGKGGRQYLGSASKSLVNDVSYLCSMVGVNCSLYEGTPSSKVIGERKTRSAGVHRLYLDRWDFSPDGRLSRIERQGKGLPEFGQTVPINGSLYTGLVRGGYPSARYHKTVSLNIVEKTAPALLDELPALHRLREADLCLVEVESITPIEADYEYVYDISVPGPENFVAGQQPICLHNSTIEGGMVCTNDEDLYETARMMRSHGMVRELNSQDRKEEYWESHPDLNPDFIFAYPAWNVRSTEINAIIGRSQLPRLDGNVQLRTKNLLLFLNNLDSSIYQTDFAIEGSSNYALTLVLKEPNADLWREVSTCLRANGVEFRRGLSGGGNQLRQPYLRRLLPPDEHKKYPRVDHVHFYGCYIGNYPTLPEEKILRLCELLNGLAKSGVRRAA